MEAGLALHHLSDIMTWKNKPGMTSASLWVWSGCHHRPDAQMLHQSILQAWTDASYVMITGGVGNAPPRLRSIRHRYLQERNCSLHLMKTDAQTCKDLFKICSNYVSKQVVEIEHLTSCDVLLMHAPAANSSSIMSLHICRSSTWQAEVRDGWPCMHATLNQQLTSSRFSMAYTNYQHIQ